MLGGLKNGNKNLWRMLHFESNENTFFSFAKNIAPFKDSSSDVSFWSERSLDIYG